MRTSRKKTAKRLALQHDGEHLEAQLTLCFMMLENKTAAEIAEEAGISKTSVYNLRKAGYNVNRRYNTINRLAKAAGLVLNVTDGTVKLVTKGRSR